MKLLIILKTVLEYMYLTYKELSTALTNCIILK